MIKVCFFSGFWGKGNSTLVLVRTCFAKATVVITCQLISLQLGTTLTLALQQAFETL